MEKFFRSVKPLSIAMSALLLIVSLTGCIATDFTGRNMKDHFTKTVATSALDTPTKIDQFSSDTITESKANSSINATLLADIQKKAIGYGKIVKTTYVDVDDSTVHIFLERNLVIITKINDDSCEIYYYGSSLTLPLNSVEFLPSDYEPNLCYNGSWVGFD